MEHAPPATPARLFAAFARIGVSSFGGGLSAWVLQECVKRRRWISEDEFLNGLALAQALPGVNVVNLAVWIGYRLAGGVGATAAALGIVVPPFVIMLSLSLAWGWLSRYPLANQALAGAAAAAIGLSLAMGLRVGRRCLRRVVPAVVMAVTFAAVGLLRLPLPQVVAVMAPLSIGIAYARERALAR